jgi:3-hydroxyisobutyryl-CoA hydrolase
MAGAGDKAFCAGGDVAALAKWNKTGAEGQAKSSDYFALEYMLDHLIATYPKPYIAYMDGITMGGGVGLSLHAPFRIATERTVFAMPETTIGFFPDVGGTFFLPRLDGYLGKYFALTSERVNGVNAFYTGIATHYVHSSSLGDLTARLSELIFKDTASLEERHFLVNETIEEFVSGLPETESMRYRGKLREAIDRCFSPDTMEEIQSALEEEAASDRGTTEWAKKTIATLKERSPTSLKVTARQMVAFRKTDIAEVFRREHQLASRFMAHPDFTEGVTARLIEKRAPKWNPDSLSAVSDADVDAMFRTETPRLELLRDDTYHDYPTAGQFGLPRERDVLSSLAKHNFTDKGHVINHFLKETVARRGGKSGVAEKVADVIQRLGVKDDKGFIRYNGWEEVQKAKI